MTSSGPTLDRPISLLNVELTPSEPLQVRLIGAIDPDTGLVLADWELRAFSSNPDREPIEATASVDGEDVVFTFIEDVTDELVGRRYRLYLQDRYVVGGRLVLARPDHPSPGTYQLQVNITDPTPVQLTIVSLSGGGDGGSGEDGKSAYELAVEEGFVGTLEEWLESLHGPGILTAAFVVDETTPVDVGDFVTLQAEDLYNVALGTIDRNDFVGSTVLVHQGPNAGLWTITSYDGDDPPEGVPFTRVLPQPDAGDVVAIMVTAIGPTNQPRLMVATNASGPGGTPDPTQPAVAFASVEHDPREHLTVVSSDSLATARPPTTGKVYWFYTDDELDVGDLGENIVNGVAGDLWTVAGTSFGVVGVPAVAQAGAPEAYPVSVQTLVDESVTLQLFGQPSSTAGAEIVADSYQLGSPPGGGSPIDPLHGVVSLVGGGVGAELVEYVPDEGWVGTDTFNYYVEEYVDGLPSGVYSSAALVTVTTLPAPDLAALKAEGKGFVDAGSDPDTVRPVGWASVEWLCTVEPNNMVDGDTWNQP